MMHPTLVFLLFFGASCSEEVFLKNSFWGNFSTHFENNRPGMDRITIPTLSLYIPGNPLANRRGRYVPLPIGGYPGAPIVCYYCNIFFGTGGYYLEQNHMVQHAPEDFQHCVKTGGGCLGPNECCEGAVCRSDYEDPSYTCFKKTCKSGSYCDNGKLCVNGYCEDRCIAARTWDTYCGWYYGDSRQCCDQRSCLGNRCTASTRGCSEHSGRCTKTSECCRGLICNDRACQHCVRAGLSCDGPEDCCDGAICRSDYEYPQYFCYNRNCYIDQDCKTPGKLCVNGYCEDKCIAARTWHTYCGWPGDKRPCCGNRQCYGNKCTAHCVKNKGTCDHSSQCCWKDSFCREGHCQGCLQVGEGDGGENGCFKKSDCCGSGRCGEAIAGICNFPKGKCLTREEGCYWSRNSCCKDLTCANRRGGGLGGGYKCGFKDDDRR